MKPTDFPIERLNGVEAVLIGQADAQRSRARRASVGRVELEPYTGHAETVDQPTGPLAAGYYESALAYYEAARQIRQATNDIIADLDRAAANEAQPVHPWPIPHLYNLTDVHRDPEHRRSEDTDQRYPRWGVIAEGGGQETAITVQRSGFGHLFFRATSETLPNLDTGEATAASSPRYSEVTFCLDYHDWDALVALVERIRAGKSIPYDQAGNIRTNEKTPGT